MPRRDYVNPVERFTRLSVTPRWDHKMFSSADSTGAGYVPLDQATVSGTRYVFVFSDTGMSRVDWYLDGALSYSTLAARPAGGWPYLGVDGSGNIAAWNTAGLGNGTHTLEARVVADGVTRTVRSSFTVDNVSGGDPVAIAGTNYDNAASIDAMWQAGGYQYIAPASIANVAAPSGFTTTARSGQGRVLLHHNVDAPPSGGHERTDVLNADATKLGGIRDGHYRVFSLSFAVPASWTSWSYSGWSWIHSLHSAYYPPSGGQSYHPYAFRLMPNLQLGVETHGGPAAPDGNLYPALPGGGGTYLYPYKRFWDITTLAAGVWYDMVYEVQMSSSGNGRMRVWLNNVLRLDTGATCYLGIRDPEYYYWKQGHTRGPDSTGTADIYHDNTFRWNSLANAFSYFGW